MALKFRRGTTAQKSGSLAFGEPYVNTTLGTLQIGLDNGDVTLASAAGLISGSSQVSYPQLSDIPSGIISSSAQIDTLFNVDGLISSSTQLSGTTIQNLSGSFTGSFKGTLSGLADYALYPLVTNSGPTTDTSLFPIFTSNANVNQYATLLSHPSSSFFYNGVTRQLNAEGFVGGIYSTNGVVSGSSQITFSDISSLPTLVSGSSQVSIQSTAGFGTYLNQGVLSTSDVRHNSLGIGMAASTTAGRIDASGDIVAYSTSDRNFKENITPIPNALEKISKISGNTYDWKVELKDVHGFEGNDVGVIAQEIEEVLPQLVTTRETGYKAVKYDKLVALLIEGIKEQQTQIHNLTLEVENLKKQKGL